MGGIRTEHNQGMILDHIKKFNHFNSGDMVNFVEIILFHGKYVIIHNL